MADVAGELPDLNTDSDQFLDSIPDLSAISIIYMVFLSIITVLNLIMACKNYKQGHQVSKTNNSSIKKQEKNQIDRLNKKSKKKERRKAFANNQTGSGQLDISKLGPDDLAFDKFDYDNMIRSSTRSPSQPK